MEALRLIFEIDNGHYIL